MSDETKVYKVKNLKTGMFRTAGAGWNSTGKAWNNLGHLKSSLATEGWYRDGCKDVPDENIVIIELIVVATPANTTTLVDFIEHERRSRRLSAKYGGPFATLVERIETAGQNSQFQWVLAARGSWDHNNQTHGGDFGELMQVVKTLKLKQNVDYKKASEAGYGGCFAFANKQQAMTARLMMAGKVTGIDIVKYVETDLDTQAPDVLNSST